MPHEAGRQPMRGAARAQVAILCNHQRSVPKGHSGQMQKMEDKLLVAQQELDDLQAELKAAERGGGLCMLLAWHVRWQGGTKVKPWRDVAACEVQLCSQEIGKNACKQVQTAHRRHRA